MSIARKECSRGASLAVRARVADRVSITNGESELVAEFAALTDQVFSEDHDPRKPTSAGVRAMLDDAHPQRRRCALRLFQVPGRARVAAMENSRLRDDHGAPIGMLGFFEAQNDPEAASAVLDAGTAWLRARGATIVRGPINYSTWNDYRFSTAGTGRFAGEPYHPAYYPTLWANAGFDVCAHYGSYWLGPLSPIVEKFARVIARGTATVRPVTAADLPSLYQLAITGFQGAYMYAPIEPDEFASLYAGDRVTAATATSFLAVEDGRPCGFVYSFVADLPDGPAGVIKTIVVDRQARGGSAYAGLMTAAIDAFRALGVDRAMGGLMHADGSPAAMGWCRPEMSFKQYVLLERR